MELCNNSIFRLIYNLWYIQLILHIHTHRHHVYRGGHGNYYRSSTLQTPLSLLFCLEYIISIIFFTQSFHTHPLILESLHLVFLRTPQSNWDFRYTPRFTWHVSLKFRFIKCHYSNRPNRLHRHNIIRIIYLWSSVSIVFFKEYYNKTRPEVNRLSFVRQAELKILGGTIED